MQFTNRSCVYRDLRWPYFPADLSWLSRDQKLMKNPLNCGQYVNNETLGIAQFNRHYQFESQSNGLHIFKEFPCNVAYQECDLPLESFPIELRCYLPNIYYGASENQRNDFLRIVALVAIKDIEVNTELLSTYYTVVHA